MIDVSRIAGLGARISTLRSRSSFLEGKLEEQEKRIVYLNTKIGECTIEIQTTQQVSTIFNNLGARSQEHFKVRVEQFVSYALTKVFEKEYKFSLEFKLARKNLTVVFGLASKETNFEPTSPTDSHGGGLCEVAGFVLRLMFLLLVHKSSGHRMILFLDEPFSWVSAQFTDNLMVLIRELADKTGVQFVIVTHNEKLTELGDKQYFFSLGEDGQTKIESVLTGG